MLSALALALACTHSAVQRPSNLEAEHSEPDLVGVRHLVGRGETLFRIAKAYGVPPDELSRANGIEDPRELEVGRELIIPESSSPLAAQGRSTAPERPGPPSAPGARDFTSAQRAPKPALRAPAHRGDLDWPLRGVLYSRFGRKGAEAHDGIDLAAPLGTPIKTARAGTVLYAGTQKGYGLIAIVEHPNGMTTLYAHNRDLRVKTGQAVRQGQVIATVGESGRTTGPHLHFEVRKDGVPVDPLDYLGAVDQRR
jgi:murein DD-endopeptidase MepM/ murein hydrolase activator NlpD